jgi:antitoxin YefM
VVDGLRPDINMFGMTAISYTDARENLSATMDRVCADRTPIIITRNRDQSVVMLSLNDYEALEETAYLTRSPANAKRLLDAMHQLEAGHGVARSIDIMS